MTTGKYGIFIEEMCLKSEAKRMDLSRSDYYNYNSALLISIDYYEDLFTMLNFLDVTRLYPDYYEYQSQNYN